MLTYPDADICARTVWGEARGEPWQGQLAVAQVMLNRWRAGKWFSRPTLGDTCKAPGQFSCWSDNDPNLPKLRGITMSDPSFRSCWDAVLTALAGPPVLAADVCHYCTVDLSPPWAAGHEPVAVIGRHKFFAGIA